MSWITEFYILHALLEMVSYLLEMEQLELPQLVQL